MTWNRAYMIQHMIITHLNFTDYSSKFVIIVHKTSHRCQLIKWIHSIRLSWFDS